MIALMISERVSQGFSNKRTALTLEISPQCARGSPETARRVPHRGDMS
jgi:hypothetical protein